MNTYRTIFFNATIYFFTILRENLKLLEIDDEFSFKIFLKHFFFLQEDGTYFLLGEMGVFSHKKNDALIASITE